MSPEQILDPPAVDALSDLYSLGAVGYFLLSGCFVFEGTNAIEICAQHLSSAPEPPSSRAERALHPDLERLIMQCLEKKPGARPASCVEIAERLQALPIERWSQPQAAEWWDANGEEFRVHRELDLELGDLGTIQARPAFTDR